MGLRSLKHKSSTVGLWKIEWNQGRAIVVDVSKEDLTHAIASWRARFGVSSPDKSEAQAPSSAQQRLDAEFPRIESGSKALPAGAARPVMEHVARIASDWFGRAGNARDHLSSYEGGVPTPEALRAAGHDLDLDVVGVPRALGDLEARDFPCILLLHTGQGVLLTGRPDAHVLMLDVDGRSAPQEMTALEAAYAGTLFLVRPALAADGIAPKLSRRFLERLGFGAAIFQDIMSYSMRHHSRLLGQLALAAFLSNVLMLSLPLFTMAVYDRVVPHQAYDTLWALAIGVCIALAIDYALRFVRLKLTDAVGVSSNLAMQAQFYRKLLRARLVDAPRSAGGISNNMRDLEGMCHLFPSLLVGVVIDVPFFALMLILLMSLGGWVAAVPFLGVWMIVVIHALGHRAGLNTSLRSSNLARMQSNLMIDTINSLEHVNACIAEQKLLNTWERLADAAGYAGHHSRLWAGFSGQATMILAQFVIVLGVVVGVYEIGNAGMTVGALTASTIIISRAMAPMGSLVSMLDKLVHLGQSVESLSKLFHARMEEARDAVTGFDRTLTGRIEFNHVTFSFEEGVDPVLKDVSFKVNPGERIGIIGRVGSGKSTVLRLMTRLVEAGAGSVMVDGHDIRQLPPRALRAQLAYMRQDTALFDDTLLANITFGLDRVEPAELEQAVALSGVRDFATRHPKGYGLMVGSRGENLSGGERQAVMMARALLAKPQVLVLDEPTAALDNAAEARLVRDIKPFLQGRTLIVATHRAPLLDLVDRIIWMDGGRIIADGPKTEILKKLTQNVA